MDTPGNILRSERERQKRSVDGIADSLRIKAEYLEAIEENRFHLLPAEIYTKAYLRLYAETLGLEGSHILRLYNSQNEADPGSGQEIVPEKKAFNYKPVVIIASVLIIMVTAFVISGHNKKTQVAETVPPAETTVSKIEPPAAKTGDTSAETRPSAAETGPAAEETRPAAEEIRSAAVETAALNTAPAETAPIAAETRKAVVEPSPVADETAGTEIPSAAVRPGAPDNFYSTHDGKLTLRITASELTWVSMRIDGEKRKEWSMRSGDAVTVTASERFEIKVGNAGGTRLHLNNKDLGELGPHGKIVDIVLP